MEPKEYKGHIHNKTAKIFYTISGSGKPLIMLHGNGQNSMFFKNQIKFFKKYFQVINIDTRGHGLSSIGNKSLSIPLLAEDLFLIIKKLGLKDICLIGFSDGGNIALYLASQKPHLFKGLVLVGINIYVEGIKRTYYELFNFIYKILDLLKFIPYFNDKREVTSLMLHNINITKDNLRNIKSKTLLLIGQNDLIELNHMKMINENIEDSTLKIVKNAGHMLLLTKYKEANTIIYKFLFSLC